MQHSAATALAQVSPSRRRYEEGAQELEEALKTLQLQLHPSHPLIASVRVQLALVTLERGDAEVSAPLKRTHAFSLARDRGLQVLFIALVAVLLMMLPVLGAPYCYAL